MSSKYVGMQADPAAWEKLLSATGVIKEHLRTAGWFLWTQGKLTAPAWSRDFISTGLYCSHVPQRYHWHYSSELEISIYLLTRSRGRERSGVVKGDARSARGDLSGHCKAGGSPLPPAWRAVRLQLHWAQPLTQNKPVPAENQAEPRSAFMLSFIIEVVFQHWKLGVLQTPYEAGVLEGTGH